MIGYVAKDKDDRLFVYNEKPEYDECFKMWLGSPDMIDITGQFSEFDNMSYTDEPIKVEINIKKV